MRQPLEVKDTQTNVPEWLVGEIMFLVGPKFEQNGQCTYMVTLKHICITIVAVEKHGVLHVVSMCLQSHVAACKVHGLVICGLSSSTIFLSHKWNN